MQFLAISSLFLLFASVMLNTALRGIRGRVGRVKPIEDVKEKFRAYTKTGSLFAMEIASVFLFGILPFSIVNCVVILLAVIFYFWSTVIAWKQYLQPDETHNLSKLRIVTSVVGNLLTTFIFYSNLMYLLELATSGS